MRQLRLWSNVSYRQLERRAEAVGDTLPHAAVSGALSREDLPPEDLVAAFVRACGVDEDGVAAWLDARRHLALADEAAVPQTSSAPREPVGPNAHDSGHPPAKQTATHVLDSPAHRRSMVIAVLCAAALLLLFGAWQLYGPASAPPGGRAAPRTTPPPAPPPASAPVTAPAPRGSATAGQLPAAGWTHIHLAAAPGLCLTEGRERNGRTDRPIAVQGSCDRNGPRTYLERRGNGLYRIQWRDPTEGTGCLSVDLASIRPGALLSPHDCTDQPGYLFRIDPFGSSYRLRPAHSGLCIGLLPPPTTGAEAVQSTCTGKPDQSFLITSD
jgi:hypothetical protein